MKSCLHHLAVTAAFSFLLTAPLLAAPPPSDVRTIDAAVRGQVVEAAGTAGRAEVLRFGDAVAPELLATAPEHSVHVAGWPVAPGERAGVVLTRHEVYAAGAKIYRVDRGRATEVPRSRLAFLWGEADGDPDTRVFAAIDPDTGQLDGFSLAPHATHEIHPLGAAKLGAAVPNIPNVPGVRQYLVAPPEVFLTQAGESPTWSCGQSGAPLEFLLNQQAPSAAIGSLDKAITTLHTAVVAVDTDKELLNFKFANNTATATSYVASLIAQMNVIYQRDLLIQLVQGTTFLRVGSDPWTQQSTGGANTNQLNEVSTYWSTTNNGIARAVVAMLSGKGTSGASGIAWVPGSLCSHAYGVSFSQVYRTGTTPSFGDVLVVAHEIGHNFGSPHTHCYSPPIDTCYNGEAANGCYSGAQSCPAASSINGVPNVTGTLMSYCHLLGGCTSSLVFHPRTVALIQPLVQAAVGSCIFPASSGPANATPSDLYTLQPCRLVDTRAANGPLGGPALGPSAQRTFTAVNACGIPSGATALVVNITAVNPTAAGNLSVYPGNGAPLGTTVNNFQPATVRANNAIFQLATDGSGTFGVQNISSGSTNVVIDVMGYFK